MLRWIVGAVAAYAAYQLFFGGNDPPSGSKSYEPPQPPVPRHVERQYWGNTVSRDDEDDHRLSGSKSYQSPQPPVPRRNERQYWANIDHPPSRSKSYQPPQPLVPRPDERQYWGNISIQDDEDDHPPSRSKSSRPPQPPVPRPDERQYWGHIVFQDDGDDHPPSRSKSYQPPQPPLPQPDQPQHQEQIVSSQRDPRNLVEAPDYASLRARARQEGDLMKQYRQQSQGAYERRDHTRAKTLSEQGKRHEQKMEDLDAKASAIKFQENNQDRAPGNVDLHGLFVKEAIVYSKRAIAEAYRRGDSEIRLIVGQGNHSEGGISRLKPEIQKDMLSRGHHVEVDPRNPGVLLVQLSGR